VIVKAAVFEYVKTCWKSFIWKDVKVKWNSRWSAE